MLAELGLDSLEQLSQAVVPADILLPPEVAAAGLPPVTVEAADLEWFRGRLGRRTEDEVRGYGWSADPDPYLDTFFIFGRATRSLGEHA